MVHRVQPNGQLISLYVVPLLTFYRKIVYQHPYLVTTSVICLITVGALLPLYLAHWWSPVSVQRAQTLVEMCTFWWIVAIINLVFTAQKSVTGGYFVTFFYAGTLGATVITLTDMHRLNKQDKYTHAPPQHDGGGVLHENRAVINAGVRDIESASERTPLIPRAEDLPAPRRLGEDTLGWMWTLEFLVLAVFPAIIMFQIMWTLLAALGPTVVDGSTPLHGQYINNLS